MPATCVERTPITLRLLHASLIATVMRCWSPPSWTFNKNTHHETCRSSQRLHDDYRQKQERARSAREAAALSAEAMAAATAHGSASPDRAAFFARQEAVLARRAEAMARARPRDEEELAECTCEWAGCGGGCFIF